MAKLTIVLNVPTGNPTQDDPEEVAEEVVDGDLSDVVSIISAEWDEDDGD